ncbi:amidohydrolase family protein [Halobellus rubicundus]|uniref:Amidohydrolase family protein n=1 Tax=Halobellus rubicundus TaxID=2996466 RepID=A0ABD5MCL5_9EURY
MSETVTEHEIIDFAAHIHPDDPPENEFAHRFVERDIGDVYRNIERYSECYDQAGIDSAVLSQPYYLGHHSAERARSANDALFEIIRDRPKYYGLASIPTAAGGEEAAAEFERCLNAGFNGGALETKTDGIELHDAEVEPILEVADQTGAPILVHPKLNESLHPDALDDTWMLNAVFGREVALAESICKVVHTGVLDRYPNLNLVYHHTAGNIASMMGRIHNQMEKFPPEVWAGSADDQIKSYREFKRQLESRIYLDISGHYGQNSTLRTALSEFPTSQLLFGTDFPFETRTTEDFDQFVNSVGAECSETDAHRIFSENALNLLVAA